MKNAPHTPFRLDGKRAVVTGGGRGIGRSCAVALARCGAHVTVISRTPEQLDDTVREIGAAGGSGTAVVGDIGDSTRVDELVGELLGKGDEAPDILVNNAAISPTVKQTQDIETEEWERIVAVNLTGTFGLIRGLGLGMLERGSGSVITVTSIAAERSLPLLAAYTASKAALGGLTRTTAVEWAPRGVRVNAVAPAYIETEMTAAVQARDKLRQAVVDRTPMNRFGRPEEVAWAVVFLASDEASYITGHTLFVDGGWTCL